MSTISTVLQPFHRCHTIVYWYHFTAIPPVSNSISTILQPFHRCHTMSTISTVLQPSIPPVVTGTSRYELESYVGARIYRQQGLADSN